jgi:hypothetical protein
MIMGDPRGGAYRRAGLFHPAVIGPPGRAGNTAMASEHSGQGRRNRLLAALTSADHSLLAPHLKELSLELGSLLQEAGEPVQQIYFPHQGMISLFYEGGCPGSPGGFAHFQSAISQGRSEK